MRVLSTKPLHTFCNVFRVKTPAEQLVFIRDNGLCENCFGRHALRECSSQKTYRVCFGRHHTMLHDANVAKHVERTPVTGQEAPKTSTTADSNFAPVSSHTTDLSLSREPRAVLLATAMNIIRASNGNYLTVRALIDQGSEVSFVAESVAQNLKLARCSPSIPVIGISAKRSSATHGVVSCTISARPPQNFSYTISAHVLPRLSAAMLRFAQRLATH